MLHSHRDCRSSSSAAKTVAPHISRAAANARSAFVKRFILSDTWRSCCIRRRFASVLSSLVSIWRNSVIKMWVKQSDFVVQAAVSLDIIKLIAAVWLMISRLSLEENRRSGFVFFRRWWNTCSLLPVMSVVQLPSTDLWLDSPSEINQLSVFFFSCCSRC